MFPVICCHARAHDPNTGKRGFVGWRSLTSDLWIITDCMHTARIAMLYSTSTRPGEGAIYRYLSRQGKIAGDIHETKSSGLSLS